ncbi:MAG: short-chain dehydrogenase, partial [Anaerolineae bacterium]|nr:short-chain dehydrogenase [Anaerolineae bacterium]
EAEGEFGEATGKHLESVFIDTGENGLFAVGEFTALTSLGQMEFVTPEEIARSVVAEIRGESTGRDIVGALDSAVTGPSYRAGFLREAALNRMRQMEREHDVDSVAFELLGPPRLSKLLFEAYLIKRVVGDLPGALSSEPATLAANVLSVVEADSRLRQHILSIGLPILLPDGNRLLRGPVIKSQEADHGWVDLRPENMARWQRRLQDLQGAIREGLAAGSSSRIDRHYPSLRNWREDGVFDVGEVVGWLFNT